jgi:DNA-binding MarR family transcriptional regulator/GNAT superfamily N-acetyltransferase
MRPILPQRRPAGPRRKVAFGNYRTLECGMARAERVAALRRFNRFYTARIGVLHERLAGGDFTLAQSRLLWELAHHEGLTAAGLARQLDLDPGYLSRLLRGLRESGLVRAQRSKLDAREAVLTLTAAGRRAFAPLDERSRHDVDALLQPLPEAEQRRLLDAAATIETLLGTARGEADVRLRALRPGDIGWVAMRHGALYAEEYGWDMRFEALVAHIAARFVERFDGAREAAWVAERDGAACGCVFLVQCRDDADEAPIPGVAQLRLLLVEPQTRGAGVGRQLVERCSAFARSAGYRRIRLWTNSVLGTARHLYEQAGYRLVASEPHESFGKALVGETWELDLQANS